MTNDSFAGPLSVGGATPIATTSVADAAEAHLRRLLFSGALKAGQELRDTVLAKELGIARPTARTAVLRLISEGLLEREPGHSARVRSFTAADVRDIYAVRRLLEFEAVRVITVEGRSTTQVAGALTAFARAGDSWEAGPDADTLFHTAVVAAAGSPRLTRTFEGLASEMRLMIGLLRSRYSSLSELYDEHAGLLAALESGDTDHALSLWAEHIDDAEGYLLSSLTDAA
ncbi:GntR family transcriptional regulator [Microbacterium sp. NPDC056044]|uniref:GntR family transcriptional regulator n=1 Tax=Microbacterium sp. NPDC056044 TaxID=3345690 RepID=UPI0035E2535F